MAFAGSVTEGVGIWATDDEAVAAEAMVRSDVAAVRAEMNLMENMVAEGKNVGGIAGKGSSRYERKGRLRGASAKRSSSLSSAGAVLWVDLLARQLRQQT
jgi:hypothetical protein